MDTFAIADATAYVEQAGWKDGTTPYVLYIAAITLQRQQQKDKATDVLESIRTHVEPAYWQASVATFLEGKLTADALLAKASPEALLTEAHAYIGIKAHIDGDAETARKHLEWVRDKGRHDYTEYRLALGELDRMDRPPPRLTDEGSGMSSDEAARRDDPHDLNRFLRAQADDYERALGEIRSGRKRTHWMWYVFPQVDGLAFSSTAKFYAIKSRDEAQAYHAHPVLGARLVECVDAMLTLEGQSATEILGSPDDLKLRSCATLFAAVEAPGSPFHQLLEKYFPDGPDRRTLQLLAGW